MKVSCVWLVKYCVTPLRLTYLPSFVFLKGYLGNRERNGCMLCSFHCNLTEIKHVGSCEGRSSTASGKGELVLNMHDLPVHDSTCSI